MENTKNKKEFRRPGGRRPERVKPDFEHKVIDVRRVTRVVSGGRRFSFSVVVVAGDRKGKIGVGIGKASDTALAIDKALNDARKNMIKLTLTDNSSIPHEAEVKYNASRLRLSPSPGRGLVAGSSARVVFDLAGLNDLNAKFSSRTKNKLNNARAAIKALRIFAIPVTPMVDGATNKPSAVKTDRVKPSVAVK
ncbi:MAG: 30S ribosomal protein S5 [Candidatus Paceibacterota bacterium]